MAFEGPPTRPFRVIARDPAMRIDGRILTDTVEIDNEPLGAGPRGHRVYVIDYDSTHQTYYRPLASRAYGSRDKPVDPFSKASDDELLENPAFHAQNTYAIVTRTLAQFEQALGRRVSWNFGGHQIAVVPHAFADANAFYSDRDQSLLFGYFPGLHQRGMIFSSLSHDVIVHETAHALLDSLRPYYSLPAYPNNIAFHEGFADLIALLSVFSFSSVVSAGLENVSSRRGRALIPARALTVESLRNSVLFRLAEQMGAELTGVLGDALRRSLILKPSPDTLALPEFQEPHRRGEILVAATLNAFLNVWVQRLQMLGRVGPGRLYSAHVVQEGVLTADRLLRAATRAIDYAPTLEITFSGFLSALLTADAEASPDDSRDNYRRQLIESFAAYGIRPATNIEGGVWKRVTETLMLPSLVPEREDMFRFLYENWRALGLTENAETAVLYVRRNRVPAGREKLDVLHEFVAQYRQNVRVRARDLHRYGIRRPPNLPLDEVVRLNGGGTLVFGENGILKYHIADRLMDQIRQSDVLQAITDSGVKPSYAFSSLNRQTYGSLHRLRQLNLPYSFLQESR